MSRRADQPARSRDLSRRYDRNFKVDDAYRATLPDMQNKDASLIQGANVPIQHVGISGFRLPMLVIARDTTHAKELLDLIESEKFFEGRYKGRVIQVDSSQTGAKEDEMIDRLLKVEQRVRPFEQDCNNILASLFFQGLPPGHQSRFCRCAHRQQLRLERRIQISEGHAHPEDRCLLGGLGFARCHRRTLHRHGEEHARRKAARVFYRRHQARACERRPRYCLPARAGR